jgi:chorismate mutase
MEAIVPPPKNLVRDARERVRNRVGAHVEEELANSTITLGILSSERESKQLEELGTFLDLQVYNHDLAYSIALKIFHLIMILKLM